MNSECCGILREGITVESLTPDLPTPVVDPVVCAKPYDANRHKEPVRKEYFLLAITVY
ncbi:hypothetical protein GCM10023184_12950 [Flaviaesturariibacter amylovorans]|uniref:Uncharacterized protein n=1 Tax=Flaviaesturariibacter amylovorans TaxID=1084520 RepID=A0ABP8GIS9_9BACT